MADNMNLGCNTQAVDMELEDMDVDMDIENTKDPVEDIMEIENDFSVMNVSDITGMNKNIKSQTSTSKKKNSGVTKSKAAKLTNKSKNEKMKTEKNKPKNIIINKNVTSNKPNVSDLSNVDNSDIWDDKYTVKKVTARRRHAGKFEYLLECEDSNNSFSKWIEESQFKYPELINEFLLGCTKRKLELMKKHDEKNSGKIDNESKLNTEIKNAESKKTPTSVKTISTSSKIASESSKSSESKLTSKLDIGITKQIKGRREKGSEFFDIEKILSRRLGSNNQPEYFIKWKNHSEAFNTWEPKSSFNCTDYLDNFDKEYSRRQKNKKDVKSSTSFSELENLVPEEQSSTVYEVDSIVSKRSRYGESTYQVKWKDGSLTWEPAYNLPSKLIATFERKKKKQKICNRKSLDSDSSSVRDSGDVSDCSEIEKLSKNLNRSRSNSATKDIKSNKEHKDSSAPELSRKRRSKKIIESTSEEEQIIDEEKNDALDNTSETIQRTTRSKITLTRKNSRLTRSLTKKVQNMNESSDSETDSSVSRKMLNKKIEEPINKSVAVENSSKFVQVSKKSCIPHVKNKFKSKVKKKIYSHEMYMKDIEKINIPSPNQLENVENIFYMFSKEDLCGVIRGAKPRKVICAIKENDEIYYMLSWKGTKDLSLVKSKVATKLCPDFIIDYYVNRLILPVF